MTVIVIGVDHRHAPLELLERLAVSGDDLPKVIADAARRDHVAEAVVLSTCNRTEIYAAVDRFHDAYEGLCEVLGDRDPLSDPDLFNHLEFRTDDAAVEHLFSVAAGLESVVIGETDILGQIRAAWDVARDEGAVGPQLNTLFRHAVEVGKRARNETAISRSIASVSAAAVAMATDRLGGLTGRPVAVLGVGDMGARTATALAGAGVDDLIVANRTRSHADELALRVGGRVVDMDDLAGLCAEIDLLVTSTGSNELLIGRSDLERAMADRNGRPLLIIDIAMPRDVDPAAGDLAGVTLLDMDDVGRFVDVGVARRRGEVDAVEHIVADEVDRYRSRRTARSAAPIVTELRRRAESVRVAELEHANGRLGDLTEVERDAVEALTRRIVAKFLHLPSVRLGELAGTVRGDRIAEALVDLFDLDDGDGGDGDSDDAGDRSSAD
ncbi:MAG: glutamyl-tRNA reductase [Actinobacteria bacterium]|nr:glutamyl-tRNA reductase [Actinomycetota bacterium]